MLQLRTASLPLKQEQKVNSFSPPLQGYNLPDSFSAAPSYADPSLLTAVMKQAEQANFRCVRVFASGVCLPYGRECDMLILGEL